MGNILTSTKNAKVSNRQRISHLEDMVLQREIALAVYVAHAGELSMDFMQAFLERMSADISTEETDKSLHDKAVGLAHEMIAEGYVPVQPRGAPGAPGAEVIDWLGTKPAAQVTELLQAQAPTQGPVGSQDIEDEGT